MKIITVFTNIDIRNHFHLYFNDATFGGENQLNLAINLFDVIFVRDQVTNRTKYYEMIKQISK